MPHPPLRFTIPAYDQAMIDFIGLVTQGLLQQDGILRSMPTRRTVHTGPMRNVRLPEPLDQPLHELGHILSIPFDVIRTTNIEAFIAILYEFAKVHQQQLVHTIIQGLTEVTEATGNTADAQGKPLSFDIVNDALEMIEISFDEQGNPLLPTMVVPPGMSEKLMAIEPTPEQLQRYTDILQRKKAKFDAQKRTRRLSR